MNHIFPGEIPFLFFQEFRIGSFSSAVGVGEERRSSLEDMCPGTIAPIFFSGNCGNLVAISPFLMGKSTI